MVRLKNEWKRYWKERTKDGMEYYGKHGANADNLINILEIKKRDFVLDIGCANGTHLTDIQKKTSAKCYGCDISPIAVSLNKNKKIKLKVADMENTGYNDKIFSKVFSLGVFEHTPNKESPYKELNRIMKIGGKAYITVPNKISFFHITKGIKMILGKWDLGYEAGFSAWQMKNIAEKNGFIVREYWITPHLKSVNIFNFLDNTLNKINPNVFGFFLNFLIEKVEDL